MPAIIRKSLPNILESRREILHTIRWQVRSSVWSPPTDVYETDEHLIVRVEIAGMRDEDFEVTIERHALFIAGTRPDFGGRRAYHQMEILSGRFEIEVEITVPVDVESSTAEYKDGFLTISLPKSQSKQIEVEE
ncbi:MAG: Hsp20/alpha crystallin family protein [Anaerolineales bacterium]|nr:Hsp20/alpha crystallin family protein [Anaerolineales bacterium]